MHGPLWSARTLARMVCEAANVRGAVERERALLTARACTGRLPHTLAEPYGRERPARLLSREAATAAAVCLPFHVVGFTRRECADAAAGLLAAGVPARMLAEAGTARDMSVHVARVEWSRLIESAVWAEIDGDRFDAVRPVERIRPVVAAAVPCLAIVRAFASA